MLFRRFKKRQLGEGDIPVASFADLAFLLNIFFILTTSLRAPTGFMTEVPAGEKGQTQQRQTTSVYLHDERIALNDADVSLSQLRRKLDELQLWNKQVEDKMILLTAAGKVKYQTYYETMANISAAGGVIAIVREEGKQTGETAKP